MKQPPGAKGYELEYLKRQLKDAAELVIAARNVGTFPETEDHRAAQLAALVATLTPEDWINILK